jgi:hypothetical protein
LWSEQDANGSVVARQRRDGILDWDNMRIRSLLSDDGVRRLRKGDVGSGMLGRVLTAELTLAMTETGL